MRGREAQGDLETWAGTGHAGLGRPSEGFGSYPKLNGKPLKDINKGVVLSELPFSDATQYLKEKGWEGVRLDLERPIRRLALRAVVTLEKEQSRWIS